MSYIAYENAKGLYYRLSGKASPLGMTMAMMIACTLAILLAYGYTWTLVNVRFLMFGLFVLQATFGYLLGWITGGLLVGGKVRSVMLAVVVGGIVGVFACLASWVFYIYFYVHLMGLKDVTLTQVITNPAWAWHVVLVINEYSSFLILGYMPTGLLLWLFWILEAAIVCGVAMMAAARRMNQRTFCESCKLWGTVKSLGNMCLGDNTEVKRAPLETHDFAIIERLGPSWSNDMWYHIYMEGCRRCDATQTLCVDLMSVYHNRVGSKKRKATKIVHRLVLSPEDVAKVLRHIAALEIAANAPEVEVSTPAEVNKASPEVPPVG